MNQKVTVVARLHAQPEHVARVRQELLRLLALTRAEKGCINYDMHESVSDPNDFLFYENWESEQDLQNHLAAPHLQRWLGMADQFLAQPVEVKLWKRVEPL